MPRFSFIQRLSYNNQPILIVNSHAAVESQVSEILMSHLDSTIIRGMTKKLTLHNSVTSRKYGALYISVETMRKIEIPHTVFSSIC